MSYDPHIEPKYHPKSDETSRVRLDSFCKTNWKTAESRDQWADVFRRMTHAKHQAEWRSIMDDETDRKVALIHVRNDNREEWLKRIGDHNLYYRPIRYTKPYQGFAHEHKPTDKSDLERITYAVISTDREALETVYNAESKEGFTDHSTVGKYLGFPDCCREFFNEVWIGQERVDPMYEISCNSENAEPIDGDRENLRIVDPNPGTNVLWRYFGLGFITHLPCSWDCEKSIDIARTRYRIMCENGYEEEANAMYQWLNAPHVWDGYKSICHIRNRHMAASSSTSCYWSKKRIEWKEKHSPGGSII